jgi:hypothetical protein
MFGGRHSLRAWKNFRGRIFPLEFSRHRRYTHFTSIFGLESTPRTPPLRARGLSFFSLRHPSPLLQGDLFLFAPPLLLKVSPGIALPSKKRIFSLKRTCHPGQFRVGCAHIVPGHIFVRDFGPVIPPPSRGFFCPESPFLRRKMRGLEAGRPPDEGCQPSLRC